VLQVWEDVLHGNHRRSVMRCRCNSGHRGGRQKTHTGFTVVMMNGVIMCGITENSMSMDVLEMARIASFQGVAQDRAANVIANIPGGPVAMKHASRSQNGKVVITDMEDIGCILLTPCGIVLSSLSGQRLRHRRKPSLCRLSLSQRHKSLSRLPPSPPRRSRMQTTRSQGGWFRHSVFGHTMNISRLLSMEVVKRMALIVVILGVAREKEADVI